MTELKSISDWPQVDGQSVKMLGKSGLTDAQAIEWAKSRGAEVVYYFPESKTAYIPAAEKKNEN